MSTSLEATAKFLLRLPRELRDFIYPQIVAESLPIRLSSIDPHPITSASVTNPLIAAEAIEAYYRYNTFIIDIDESAVFENNNLQLWGPHASLVHSNIRHLIVRAREADLGTEIDYQFNQGVRLEPESVTLKRLESRPAYLKWISVLKPKKLESLTVEMQKCKDRTFTWHDFSNVLCLFRVRNPTATIYFKISFDDMLIASWSDPYWSRFPDINTGEPYKPMGYVDVTHLFASPDESLGEKRIWGHATEDDRLYVNEWLPDKKMHRGPSVKSGLLSESDRRSLAEFYVVKEPALMRVLIEQQFTKYLERRGSDAV